MKKIGFYPVVDSSEWIKRLTPLGVPTIQLRIKNKPLDVLEQEIKDSIQIANQYRCNLYINDYWALAIKHNAHGIHLGQEDIQSADINAIHDAHINLGISTHNDREVAAALDCDPYYIAYGPIYETTTKEMKASPRGTGRLCYWVNALNLPVVAIGGINLTRLDDVLQTNVDGIAVVSAVTQAPDFNKATLYFLNQIHKTETV